MARSSAALRSSASSPTRLPLPDSSAPSCSNRMMNGPSSALVTSHWKASPPSAMILSSACPSRQTDRSGSTRRSSSAPTISYTTDWDTIQGLVDAERTQSLPLSLVRGGFAKVARVTVEHPRHVIGSVAARAESERFLASFGCLIVAPKEGPGVPSDHVGFAALRIRQQGAIGAIERRLVSRRRIADPAKTSLIDQREPQDQECRRIYRVDGQRALARFLGPY